MCQNHEHDEVLSPVKVRLADGPDKRNLLGAFTKTAGIRSGQVSLKPGESVGEHNTGDREEVIVVFQGTAEVSKDKKALFTVTQNEICYMPPYSGHNVKNSGDKELKYIYIVAPIAQGLSVKD